MKLFFRDMDLSGRKKLTIEYHTVIMIPNEGVFYRRRTPIFITVSSYGGIEPEDMAEWEPTWMFGKWYETGGIFDA